MALPSAENRRAIIERVVGQHLPEPVRGAAESREIALARLAAPLARVASGIGTAWRFDGDTGQTEEVYGMLSTPSKTLPVPSLPSSSSASRETFRV